METLPTRCVLRHRMFTAIGTPLFRRAEGDGTPVMVLPLGDREAAIPLGAAQREFGIEDDSPDGLMLGLIAQALDFVSALRLGDPLPTEVLTGQASWSPDPAHVEAVNARLRLQLVDWLLAGRESERTGLKADTLLQLADDPSLRTQVHAALSKAALELELPGAEAVLNLMEALAGELAYIEALRDRLLGRMMRVFAKLEQLARCWPYQNESLRQVRRLGATAIDRTRARFEELDAQTGEVLALLRNADSQRTFIRSHRDWLYRSLRGWEPILAAWEAIGWDYDQDALNLLRTTYQFLAARYMPMQEWLSATRPAADKPKRVGMIW